MSGCWVMVVCKLVEHFLGSVVSCRFVTLCRGFMTWRHFVCRRHVAARRVFPWG